MLSVEASAVQEGLRNEIPELRVAELERRDQKELLCLL